MFHSGSSRARRFLLANRGKIRQKVQDSQRA